MEESYSAITFTDLLDGYPVSGPNQIEDSKHGFRPGQQIAESLLRGIESKSCDEIGVLKKIIQSVSSASFENLPGGFLKYLSRSEKHTEIITQMDRLGWLGKNVTTGERSVTTKEWVSVEPMKVMERSVILMARDVCLSRAYMIMASEVSAQMGVRDLPPSELMEDVYRNGDEVLLRIGYDGFKFVKTHEEMCVGVALKKFDTLRGRGRFLEAAKASAAQDLESVGFCGAGEGVLHVDKVVEKLFEFENVVHLSEIFGMNKVWGYAKIAVVEGFQKAKDLMQQEQSLGYKENESNGRLPPVKHPGSHPRLVEWFTVQQVDIEQVSVGAPSLLDWSEVRFDRFLRFDTMPDVSQLLLDKAISRPLHQLYGMYSEDLIGASFDDLFRRRLLLALWDSKSINIPAIFSAYWREGFHWSTRIFAMTPKEQQMDRAPRMFTYTVPTRRLWHAALEHNIKEEVFALVPDQTMTMPGMKLTKRLLEPGSSTGPSHRKGGRFWVGKISLDFKKWCQHFAEDNSTPIGEVLDDAFGIAPTYARTQKEFGRAIELPPNERVAAAKLKLAEYLDRLNHGEDVDGAFISNKRGGEGIDQKLWTLATIAFVRAVSSAVSASCRLTGQGDNQVIEVRIRVPDDVPVGDEDLPHNRQILENRLNKIYEELITRSELIGLPLTREETWLSETLLIYGKRWVYRDSLLPQALKRIAKIATSPNAAMPERDVLCATSWAAALNASDGSTNPFPAYLIACSRSFARFRYELYSNSVMPSEGKMSGCDEKSIRKVPKEEQALHHLPHTSVLGGQPVLAPLHFLYRGHPDPLTLRLSSMKICAEGGLLSAKKHYIAIQQRRISKTSSKDAGSAAVRDPSGVPLERSRDAQSYLRDAVRDGLKSLGSRNEDFSPLTQDWLREDDKRITYLLMTMSPFNPREQRSPGQKVGIPLLVPINLLAMPEQREGIQDLEGAVRALRLAEELCAKLCFVGQVLFAISECVIDASWHVFTELVPLPLGPLAEKAPLNLTDPVWAPNGSDGLHPQLTRGGQLELMQESKGFDGVKIVVLGPLAESNWESIFPGAIAAIADRVLRIRTVLPGIPKPQGDGPIEATTPEISVARTSVASYFTEVKKSLDVPSGKDRTLFDWDQHGWMMWVSKEAGEVVLVLVFHVLSIILLIIVIISIVIVIVIITTTAIVIIIIVIIIIIISSLKKFVQAICATHLLQAGGDWAQLAAGADPYLAAGSDLHHPSQVPSYRDIIFYWKYFLCTDLRVFPKCKELAPQLAYLKWQVVDEQKAYGCPPNRGKVFMVQGLGKAPGGNALQSSQKDFHLFETMALLSFLTVPYIRMPLVMAFFTTGDRVNSLFDRGLQEILEAFLGAFKGIYRDPRLPLKGSIGILGFL
ncbi:L [Symbiodinium microadriaticum]|nr:L [Symbiodinium microadriaticum] [Symbiodinium microadriaticum]